MFKFLDPSGCTRYGGQYFVYNLPGSGEKWAMTRHPNPAEADGKPCGPGRLHLMKGLDARYAPAMWWPWWAKGKGLTGEDDEKAAYTEVHLRRILAPVFWRALRPPFNWGSGAYLMEVYLVKADLRGANLAGAHLTKADLYKANLSRADLSGINLGEATWDDLTIWPRGFEPPSVGGRTPEYTEES